MKRRKKLYGSREEYERDMKYILIYGYNELDKFRTKKAAKYFAERNGIWEYRILTKKQYSKLITERKK